MKKIIGLLLLMLVPASVLCAGETHIKIDNTKVKKDGDKVHVTFDIDASQLRTNYKIVFYPTLTNSEGRSMELTPLSVVGRRRDIADQRVSDTEGSRIVVSRKQALPVTYSEEIPFEQWMQTVGLDVDKTSRGCCTYQSMGNEVIAENKLLYYDIKPAIDTRKLEYELTELEKYDLENPFLHPMEDYQKRHDILLKDRDKGTAAVTFRVGSATIDMNDKANTDALDAISKAFELIENDPNAILKNIMVAGYASPEGSLATNTRLALNRANAVKNFIKSRMKNPHDNMFEIYNGREDWDALRDKVQNSQMDYRDEILNIIDSYSMEQEIRKTKLKQVGGGAPYRYMLKEFYPALRSAGYVQVYYQIDRRATIATAVADANGRTTWVDPDSPANRGVTAINKAIDLMLQHKFQEALDILDEFKEDPRVWNNIGVCHMMMGNLTEATPYFERAVANGDQDAARNLNEISWANKVEK